MIPGWKKNIKADKEVTKDGMYENMENFLLKIENRLAVTDGNRLGRYLKSG